MTMEGTGMTMEGTGMTMVEAGKTMVEVEGAWCRGDIYGARKPASALGISWRPKISSAPRETPANKPSSPAWPGIHLHDLPLDPRFREDDDRGNGNDDGGNGNDDGGNGNDDGGNGNAMVEVGKTMKGAGMTIKGVGKTMEGTGLQMECLDSFQKERQNHALLCL